MNRIGDDNSPRLGGRSEDADMTRAEFEAQYSARSGLTVDELTEYGLYAMPCDCDYKYCEGWQMLHRTIDGESEDMPARWARQKFGGNND